VARGNEGVHARHIQGREAGGPKGVYVSVSDYPPGSGGGSVTAMTKVVYVVAPGRLRIRHDSGEVDLEAGDSISFEPGESRAAFNVTDEPARLVVIHQPESA
jgi:mannose-6-phosphate isomerase-like protein (cupin superfamily)